MKVRNITCCVVEFRTKFNDDTYDRKYILVISESKEDYIQKINDIKTDLELTYEGHFEGKDVVKSVVGINHDIVDRKVISILQEDVLVRFEDV